MIWLAFRSKSEIWQTWWQTTRSPCAHKANTLLRSMIDSAKPIILNVEINILKRNDTHNKGNYHKCFLDLERIMCAPAFKISKLRWTAVLPCFLGPLPVNECPVPQGRSWRFPGIISLLRSLLGHSFKHASVNNFKARWHERCITVFLEAKNWNGQMESFWHTTKLFFRQNLGNQASLHFDMSSLKMEECWPCSGKIMVLKRTSYLDLRLPFVWVSQRPQRLLVIIDPEKSALNPWAFQWHGKAAVDRLLGFEKGHEVCAAAGLILKICDRGTE